MAAQAAQTFVDLPSVFPRQLTQTTRYIRDVPVQTDAASDDYYTVSIIGAGTPNEEATVTAIALVIATGSTFATAFHGRALKKLTIIADTIALQMNIVFPGTELFIYARDINVGGGCSFSTEPMAYVSGAAHASDGLDGPDGGDIHLFVGSLGVGSGAPAFITRGAAGQDAGSGTAGTDGNVADGWTEATTGFVSGAFNQNRNDTLGECTDPSLSNRLWALAANSRHDIIQIHYEVSIIGQSVFERIAWPYSWAAPVQPTDGAAPTVIAGKPGSGGHAGSIFANVPVQAAWVDMAGGTSARPQITRGGAAGYVKGAGGLTGPGSLALMTCDASFWGSTYSITSVTPLAARSAGADHAGTAPDRSKGTDGTKDDTQRPITAWLHPLHPPAFLHFINDAWLNADLDSATTYLDRIIAALADWQAAAQIATTDDMGFSAALRTFSAMRLQIARKLDYFGNPAGWNPTLSLDTNMSVYKTEVSRALPVIYLAQWFEAQASITTKKAENYGAAISHLVEKRKKDGAAFDALEAQIGPVMSQIADLAASIDQFKTALAAEEARQKAMATVDVWANHLLKIASAVCSLIPVGQPELGMVGSGLTTVSDYIVDKDPTVANVGGDLLAGLSTVTKYGLDQKAASIKAALNKAAPTGVADDVAKQQMAGNLEKVSGNLGDFTRKFTEQFKALSAPKDEIEVQLGRLEAADPYFQDLSKKLRALNEQKEALFQRLNSSLVQMAQLSGDIGQSYGREIQLYDEISSTQAEVSQTTRLIIKGMKQRAMATLQLFQYYLLKSYEYQMLATLSTVDLRLDMIVDSVSQMAAAAGAVQPYAATSQTYDPIQTYLESVYDAILTELIKQIESPTSGSIGFQQITNARTYQLAADELALLNDPNFGQVAINLFDKDIVKLTDENARIMGVTVSAIEGTANVAGANRTCRVAVQFFGDGILRNGRDLFAIRAFDANQTANPSRTFVREWSATYDEVKAATTPDTPSTRSAELVSTLVDQCKSAMDKSNAANGKPLDSRLYDPPAWCELAVQRMDSWLTLTKVEITFAISFQDQSGGNLPFVTQEEHGVSGPIWVSYGGKEYRRITSSFDTVTAGEGVGLRAGYFGDRMVGQLVDLDNAKATDVAGPGPWQLQMPATGGRRLQFVLRDAVFAAPLEAPRVFAWSALRDASNTANLAPHHWDPKGQVQYALSFVDSQGNETGQSPWSEPAGTPYYIFPILCDIWRDPSGTAVARRLYRRFIDGSGKAFAQERVLLTDSAGNDPLANNLQLRSLVDSMP